MRETLTTPPSSLPVTAAEIKDHMRLDGFVEDDAIAEAYVTAAVGYLDGSTGILGRCIMEQVWSVGFHDWRACLRLPFPDVTAVTVSYRDENDVVQTVASDQFDLVEEAMGSVIRFKDVFPDPAVFDDTPYPITVSLTAGYGEAADVPWPLKAAILLIAAHLFQFRDGRADGGNVISPSVLALVRPFRRVKP